jgi:hypothetical protein
MAKLFPQLSILVQFCPYADVVLHVGSSSQQSLVVAIALDSLVAMQCIKTNFTWNYIGSSHKRDIKEVIQIFIGSIAYPLSFQKKA